MFSFIKRNKNTLLVSDMGIEATMSIIDSLTERVSRKQLSDEESLFQALEEDIFVTALLSRDNF